MLEDIIKRMPDRRHVILKIGRLLEEVSGLRFEDLVARLRGGEDPVPIIQGVLDKLSGLSPSSVHFYLWLLKKILRFYGVKLSNEELRSRLFLPSRRPVRVDRAPTMWELRRMILGTRSKTMRALIHLLATTGLRIGEALSLRVENLDLQADPPCLRVVSGKTGRVRVVPLTRECVEALKPIMPEKGYLFHVKDKPEKPIPKIRVVENFYELLRRLGLLQRDSSGKGYQLHLHSLRKFYKTRLEEVGVNTLLIEAWMGHSLGIADHYFRPTSRMWREEWAKAEKALTLFPEEEPGPRPGLEERLQILEEKLWELYGLIRRRLHGETLPRR